MVSCARLEWLSLQIYHGRSAHVRFSFNESSGTEKMSFTLLPWDGVHRHSYRPALLSALESVRAAMFHNTGTDKGHTHKSQSGASVMEFWRKQCGVSAQPQLYQSSNHLNPGAQEYVPIANLVEPVEDCMAALIADGLDEPNIVSKHVTWSETQDKGEI